MPAFPRNLVPAMDIDTDTFHEMLQAAEAMNGTLAVTGEGRLVVYGDSLDAVRYEEQQPFSSFYVEAIDHDVIAFKFD